MINNVEQITDELMYKFINNFQSPHMRQIKRTRCAPSHDEDHKHPMSHPYKMIVIPSLMGCHLYDKIGITPFQLSRYADFSLPEEPLSIGTLKDLPGFRFLNQDLFSFQRTQPVNPFFSLSYKFNQLEHRFHAIEGNGKTYFKILPKFILQKILLQTDFESLHIIASLCPASFNHFQKDNIMEQFYQKVIDDHQLDEISATMVLALSSSPYTFFKSMIYFSCVEASPLERLIASTAFTLTTTLHTDLNLSDCITYNYRSKHESGFEAFGAEITVVGSFIAKVTIRTLTCHATITDRSTIAHWFAFGETDPICSLGSSDETNTALFFNPFGRSLEYKEKILGAIKTVEANFVGNNIVPFNSCLAKRTQIEFGSSVIIGKTHIHYSMQSDSYLILSDKSTIYLSAWHSSVLLTKNKLCLGLCKITRLPISKSIFIEYGAYNITITKKSASIIPECYSRDFGFHMPAFRKLLKELF